MCGSTLLPFLLAGATGLKPYSESRSRGTKKRKARASAARAVHKKPALPTDVMTLYAQNTSGLHYGKIEKQKLKRCNGLFDAAKRS